METELRQYIARVIDTVGSDVSVGRFLGLSDGSRVGTWRKGLGRPSELMCIKLARWQGDDPIDVLRLAGYSEMADLLQGHVPEASGANTHSVKLLQAQLAALKSMIEMAMTHTSQMGGEQHGAKESRYPKAKQ